MNDLIKALVELGFDKDEPINGGDVVSVIAEHWDRLKKNPDFAKAVAEAAPRVVVICQGGVVQHAVSNLDTVELIVIDKDDDDYKIDPEDYMDERNISEDEIKAMEPIY